MRNILLVLLLAGLLPAHAQKIVEKHIDLSTNQYLHMNFQISDSIRIVTWNKKEVYVKSSININNNKNNDDYKMTFNESGSTINVTARLEMDRNNDSCCCRTCHTEILHEIYIPENTDFSVETINGNITIAGNTAEIRAKSISGFIDLAIAPERKADLKMRTITGTMYSNFDLQTTSRHIKQVGGGSVSAGLNGGGGKTINLETISGNIFFRKAG